MAESVSAPGAACCQALHPDDFVEVHALASDRGKLLNGLRGAVLRYVEASGRFEVCLGPAGVAGLKPENLRRLEDPQRLASLEARLLEVTDTPEVRARLADLRAEAPDRAAFEARLRPLLAELHGPVHRQHGVGPAWRRSAAAEGGGASGAAARLEELCAFGTLGPAGLERGERLEVAGLESAGGRALNGLLVRLRSWDAAKGRYQVALARDDSQTKAVRPENLKKIPGKSFAASREAREFQHRLREAFTLPSAQAGLKDLLKTAGTCNMMDDVVLTIQRPVLEEFGFRGDLVGQYQMCRALESFEADADLCRDAAEPLDCHSSTSTESQECLANTVIFLDIDGVLHSLHGEDLFKESCCALLEQILRSTRATIVLSSTWRTDESKVSMINSMLRQRRLLPIRDLTPDLEVHREIEICEWLDSHPEVARWIAIDDQDLQSRDTDSAKRMRGHFVHTDSTFGLKTQDAPLAIALVLAQGAELSASSFLHSLTPLDLEDLLSEMQFDPEDGGGRRKLSAAEQLQLRQLYESCRVGLPSFQELATRSGIGPELQRALAEHHLDSTRELASLSTRGEVERKVLGLWFDPGDGGGERTLTASEVAALRQLGDACRREVGPALGEVAESCGIPAALVSALTEILRGGPPRHRGEIRGKEV